ncbi:dihydroorotate dehydrogenase-like protein [Leptonema illini]|uniref:Dihydroorotate oxidase n=1 Tax=Leptonema illini DSM 21528 TaxID=929563 RepID=H2CED7_9LEPT|nr:dihydroorotate dehydrogenase-like protein [Leptonema illini]EHQ05523.1 dihydroorotate oxidase [Leptonema illini DSM 21528]
MNLKTTYLGLDLAHPIVPSASPLSENTDTARRLEDAGAPALVMYSLFEEQILDDQHRLDHFLEHGSHTFAEALTYFPEPDAYASANGEAYLEQIRRLKEHLKIPVIASLNGVSSGGWMSWAEKIEQAGADALELNIFYIPADFDHDPREIEEMYVNDVRAVRERTGLKIAVKIAPFFSSMSYMARRLEEAGADALVMFNRFYEPDFDIEQLQVKPRLKLSQSGDGLLALHWIAILRDHLKIDLAATGGIHDATDIVKALMAGADITMTASALLRRGPEHIQNLVIGLQRWMEEHEYVSVEQMKGSMSYAKVANPSAFERANYMKTLQSYRPERL